MAAVTKRMFNNRKYSEISNHVGEFAMFISVVRFLGNVVLSGT